MTSAKSSELNQINTSKCHSVVQQSSLFYSFCVSMGAISHDGNVVNPNRGAVSHDRGCRKKKTYN